MDNIRCDSDEAFYPAPELFRLVGVECQCMHFAVLIAVVMIFTLERDDYAFGAHPVPYVLGAFLMWGLLVHFHWTRYKKEGDASSRVFAVLWGLHILIAAALLIGLGWQTYLS